MAEILKCFVIENYLLVYVKNQYSLNVMSVRDSRVFPFLNNNYFPNMITRRVKRYVRVLRVDFTYLLYKFFKSNAVVPSAVITR